MTREEAINVLSGFKVVGMRNGKTQLYQALYLAIAALREQPRWISVEEALPPDQSDVLVVVLWNGEWQTMTGWLSCVTHEWRCVTPYGEHKPEKVTYWMSLPEPPTEEEV